MKIAILSDAHDHADNTRLVIKLAQKMNAEALLFCGDFCSPGPAIVMCEFQGPIYAVFGNNDGDHLRISRRIEKHKADVTIFEEGEGILTLSGRKIVITHYPLYAQALARTGDYDLVCFGHDHRARVETYDKCLAVNPGTLNPFRPQDILAFAIYDSITHTAQLYGLDGAILKEAQS